MQTDQQPVQYVPAAPPPKPQRRGCGCLVLSTQPSMAAAQRLYRAEGFERAPSRDWVHANGSERLVFARALAAA